MTFSSVESSSERSMVCKLAQSSFSSVVGGGIHLGTNGLPVLEGGTNAPVMLAVCAG